MIWSMSRSVAIPSIHITHDCICSNNRNIPINAIVLSSPIVFHKSAARRLARAGGLIQIDWAPNERRLPSLPSGSAENRIVCLLS